jgi:hypothetical protein
LDSVSDPLGPTHFGFVDSFRCYPSLTVNVPIESSGKTDSTTADGWMHKSSFNDANSAHFT